MSKILDIDFRTGSLLDKVNNTLATNTDGILKNTEKGISLYLSGTAKIEFSIANLENIVVLINCKGDTNFTFATDTDTVIESIIPTYQQLSFIVANPSNTNPTTTVTISSTAEVYITQIRIFSTALTTEEINIYYKEFLDSKTLQIAKSNFIDVDNYSSGDVTFFDDFRYEKAEGVSRIPNDWIKGDGEFYIGELVESDIVDTNLKVGDKVLKVLTIGNLFFHSKQNIGSWEFDYYVDVSNSGVTGKHTVAFLMADKEFNSYFAINIKIVSSGFPIPTSKLYLEFIEYYGGVNVNTITLGELTKNESSIKITKESGSDFYVYIDNVLLGNYTPINDITSSYTGLNFGKDTDYITNFKYTQG